ncbi:MAG TPA: class I SAM-dependent methyltransferase [Anaerolineae bacterium]|nr:class I SAM-dependent methyltransferase [Anaerolineae bacterium]HIP71877.1 class I SAM-dependent methyltransferase [Anaerolineae bacterium]
MRPEIIQKLLELNQTFYNSFAESFSQTRRPINPGFDRLLAALPGSPVDLLDVGCGNGRFGHYLRQKRALRSYVGVDFSGKLLQIAQEMSGGIVYQRDLSRPDSLAGLGQFDVVACLAALHHIPGRENRVQLLREMGQRVREDGRIFLSTWQFMDSDRQRRKVRYWSEIGLSAADVAANDYLLTWQRGGFSYRYACMIDEGETVALAQAAGLTIVEQFRSDGREGNLSLYTVLQRD